MSTKKKKQTRAEVYEEKEGSGKLGNIILSMALYGLMLLLGYIIFAVPEAGTAMGAFRDVLRGLGGSFAIVLPIVVGWIATLFAITAAGRRVSVWKSFCDGMLFLCGLTIAQITVAETILSTRMVYPGFANFVSRSYQYGHGGGAVGAIAAWPLYINFGKGGGILITLLAALLFLTANGRAIRISKWAYKQFTVQNKKAVQRRLVRKNERMFDEFDEPNGMKGAFDPAADDIHDVRRSENPVRPKREKPQSKWEYDPVTGVYNDRSAPEKTAPHKKKKDEGIFEDSILSEEPKPRKRPPVNTPENSVGKTRQEKKPIVVEEDLLFCENDECTSARKSAAKPERKEAAPTAKVPESKSALTDDDLHIAPEICDVLEGDEPPFDVPKEEKKPLKKLKRMPKVEAPEENEYNYPPIDLLEAGDGVTENHRDSDMQKAQLLEDTLKQFGIASKLTGIAHGPAVTRFELQPAAGIKVSRITSLADDIAMHLAAMSVRIEAPIPGKAAVGVEIPNEKVEMVRLRDVLESAEARKSVSKVAVCLGKDNSGRYIVADIAKMPHVLIAGQTGSGKSVCINSIITSILFRATPDEVKLILIDPKVVELSIYNEIPHLICPVVTDCKKAASALEWAVMEMTNRYKRFADRGVRDIKGYNKALQEGEKPMPQMVIIIDELADLMMVAPGEVEDSICRLAQLARAAGMHLVIATQRPSVNVITGIIKANIPTRIAFSVASQIDSRTMIDHGGAEKLLGNGDMLFVPSGINKPMRVQGAWVSDEEVHAIVSYIKERSGADYDPDMIEKMENAARTDAEREEFAAEYDPRLPEAVEIVIEAGQASVSMLQRRMRVGYARAGRLIDEMEQRGIVSEADGAKPRTVLISRDDLDTLFE